MTIGITRRRLLAGLILLGVPSRCG